MRFVIGFTVGCVAPEELLVFGEVDGTDLLVDTPAEAFAERVRPIGVTAARLLPDGPVLVGAVRPSPDPLTVVDPGVRPRISVDRGDVRILLYLDRADLQPRVVGRVDGTGPDGDGRVVLPPGAEVEIVDREQDRVHVSFGAMMFEVEAWLPGSAVDEVWRDDEVAVQRVHREPEGVGRGILGQTEILDRPSGTALVRVAGEADRPELRVQVVGEEVRGYVPVVLERWDVRVEGWAHVDDLVDQWVGWGCSCCGGLGRTGWGSARFTPNAIVPAGTLLRAGADGPVVGLALADLEVPVDARIDGALVQRATEFGQIELWVGPEEVL